MWLPGASKRTVRRWRADRHRFDWRPLALLFWLLRKTLTFLLKGAWLSVKHSRHATKALAAGPGNPLRSSSHPHLGRSLPIEDSARLQHRTHRGDA